MSEPMDEVGRDLLRMIREGNELDRLKRIEAAAREVAREQIDVRDGPTLDVSLAKLRKALEK